ncbi:hypothetical protein AYO38_09465 [bacterium SCGC AG-212-C10]|nr:hypothetical protein AYO38_09465 [bacterium SCGC AG-212-C10]
MTTSFQSVRKRGGDESASNDLQFLNAGKASTHGHGPFSVEVEIEVHDEIVSRSRIGLKERSKHMIPAIPINDPSEPKRIRSVRHGKFGPVRVGSKLTSCRYSED